MLKMVIFYVIAGFCEIFGCYGFWLYFREQRPFYWVILGLISLIIFAFCLAKIDISEAGRTYAIYGGIYIVCSFVWLILVEKGAMNKFDAVGLIFVLLGAFIIYTGANFAKN